MMLFIVLINQILYLHSNEYLLINNIHQIALNRIYDFF
jgi:hypothetical protein